ncbi:MAG: hypothetical protein ABI354_02120 [Candidatus Saccharimonadales bacterium]
MYKYVIIKSDKGPGVYVNLINSPAGHYLSRQPYVINLLKEILPGIKLKGEYISIEHDMGRTIGNTDIVETSEKDTIFYALPYKKDVFSRFAKNRYPIPSHKLSLVLHRDGDGSYELHDTWIGPCTPPFPGAENEKDNSKEYWENHAYVQDAQAIQSKTITKTCPY